MEKNMRESSEFSGIQNFSIIHVNFDKFLADRGRENTWKYKNRNSKIFFHREKPVCVGQIRKIFLWKKWPKFALYFFKKSGEWLSSGVCGGSEKLKKRRVFWSWTAIFPIFSKPSKQLRRYRYIDFLVEKIFFFEKNDLKFALYFF